MNIQINDNYRVESDAFNMVLQQRGIKGETSHNPGQEVWKDVAYYTNLKQLYDSYIVKRICTEPELEGVKQIVDFIGNAHEEFMATIKEYAVKTHINR